MNHPNLASDRFDPALRKTLSALFDTMIPANVELGAPSAGDDPIVDDAIRTMDDATKNSVAEFLTSLDMQSDSKFHELDYSARFEIFKKLEATRSRPLRTITSLLLQCYYRADKALESLGMEARPPYPIGHEVEDSDWSLLDPVKARGKIYREV